MITAETIDRIMQFKGGELPVVSVYVRVDADPGTRGVFRTRAASLLDQIRPMTEDRSLAREARLLAALGLPACLWAGSVAAVEELLVQDGVVVPGTVCDRCGWHAPPRPVACAETRCATPPDVVDELVQVVMDMGGSVEHVEVDTELREHVVAASLRFPLPPEPQVEG